MARHHEDDNREGFLGDDSGLEVGMNAPGAIDDRQSSTMMPWTHLNSIVPGSSIRGSAQKASAKAAPSPLFGTRSVVHSIERHSEAEYSSDDVGGQIPFMDSDPMDGLEFGVGAQVSGTRLDASSQQFLNYALDRAEKSSNGTNPHRRRWIEFEQLANPGIHDKQVAAQAFLHVLSLATMNAVTVHQDGAESLKPFGAIHIGICTSVVGDTN